MGQEGAGHVSPRALVLPLVFPRLGLALGFLPTGSEGESSGVSQVTQP